MSIDLSIAEVEDAAPGECRSPGNMLVPSHVCRYRPSSTTSREEGRRPQVAYVAPTSSEAFRCDNSAARGNRIYTQSRAPPRALLEAGGDQPPLFAQHRVVVTRLRRAQRAKISQRPVKARRVPHSGITCPPSQLQATRPSAEAIRLDRVDKCLALPRMADAAPRANNVAMRTGSI